MYSSNSNEFLDIFSIIQGIISFIMMIVFFVMASNISKIKKTLGNYNSIDDLIKEAERQVFYGNIEKATDFYHKAAYRMIKDDVFERKRKVLDVASEISKVGGVISKEFLKYIEDNCR